MVNQEHPRKITCDCGCNIEFMHQSLGWDMHFIYDGIATDNLFTEPKMLNYSWYNYIDINLYQTWGELWIYISNNRNTNNAMLHLYNQYKNFNAPLDSILSLDYIF